MSDVMLLGCLRMPLDLWNDSAMFKSQQQSRCVEAADLIQKQQEEIEILKGHIVDSSEAIYFWGSYASEYFQEKHDLKSDIEKYKKLGISNE